MSNLITAERFSRQPVRAWRGFIRKKPVPCEEMEMDFRYPGRLFTPAGFIFFMAAPGIVPLRFGRGGIYSYITENRNQYDTANRKTERNNQSKQHGAFAFTLPD